jgi:hypothetical protein
MSMPKHEDETTAMRNPLPASVNADLRGSWPAILRAAQRARLVAQQTGTDLIVVRNGQVVRVAPGDKTEP